MEQLAKAIFENFSAILSGVLAIIGVFVGCLLNLLISEYQNKVRLAFVAESTPNDELTEPELRTKTSPSEWSIRIINTGRTACFLESFEIVRKGRVLVDCYEVCDNHDSIMPNGNILYTLMQQDADAMQHNFSKYYKKPCKAYFSLIHAIQRIPILRNCITNPEFKQGKCKNLFSIYLQADEQRQEKTFEKSSVVFVRSFSKASGICQSRQKSVPRSSALAERQTCGVHCA